MEPTAYPTPICKEIDGTEPGFRDPLLLPKVGVLGAVLTGVEL